MKDGWKKYPVMCMEKDRAENNCALGAPVLQVERQGTSCLSTSCSGIGAVRGRRNLCLDFGLSNPRATYLKGVPQRLEMKPYVLLILNVRREIGSL